MNDTAAPIVRQFRFTTPAELGFTSAQDAFQRINDPKFLKSKGFKPLVPEHVWSSRLVEEFRAFVDTSSHRAALTVMWSNQDENSDYYLRRYDRDEGDFLNYIQHPDSIGLEDVVVLEAI